MALFKNEEKKFGNTDYYFYKNKKMIKFDSKNDVINKSDRMKKRGNFSDIDEYRVDQIKIDIEKYKINISKINNNKHQKYFGK